MDDKNKKKRCLQRLSRAPKTQRSSRLGLDEIDLQRSIQSYKFDQFYKVFQGHRTKVIRAGKDSISGNYLTKCLFCLYLKADLVLERI
jgi:hypothetical protein